MTSAPLSTLDLNGTWRLRWCSGQRGNTRHSETPIMDEAMAIDAAVPGEVHLALMAAGLLADPGVGANVLAARWVEECVWSYRRGLDTPAAACAPGVRAWLVFEQLDYAARIVLDGVEVGTHANCFRPCRVEVTGRLRPGAQVLVVHVDAGLFGVGDKPAEGYWHHWDARLHKRHWLRKPQCQFEWDWAPRLANVGIPGPVRLEWTAAPVRLDQLVPLVAVDPGLQRARVEVRQFVENLGSEPLRVALRATLPALGVEGRTETEVPPGRHAVAVGLPVENPPLWWPRGHGDQPLFEVRTEVSAVGTVLGGASARIGFRHVAIDRSPRADGGEHFVVTVNGRRIFCKGANVVPADLLLIRADAERYRGLIERAEELNFNFLRVWGGGVYEHDEFFRLADERGFLVWQEFVYACSRYPTSDPEFHREAVAEAEFQVRRLARHPSLVVWCGNNEIETAEWHWGWDRRGLVVPDHGFFHLVLPRVLAREDPTRFYWPSSPYSGPGRDPNDDTVGDQHPWSIGFGETDFRLYRAMTCSFPNEGGILGPPALPTLEHCLPEGQRRPGSLAWQMHDNAVAHWGEPSYPDEMLRQWLGRDPRTMSLEEFCYWGGLVQGEGLREYTDNFRRRMFDSAAAVFWMFNDTWPVVRSWTPIDYFLRRTPCFHPVRRAMAPVSIVLVEEDGWINVHGVNDTPAPVAGSLRFGVFALAGGPAPLDRSTAVTLPANASTILASFPRAALADPRAQLGFAVLTGADHRLLARNKLVLPRYRELAWARPEISVALEGGEAVFAADVFVWGVCLDLGGERPLADNFFDLYPGQPYRLPWADPEAPRILHVGNLVPA